jgi:hypothetical protein
MKTFAEYFNTIDDLEEKLIVLGKGAYPKFGTVVIMAGGAGSGKGFIKERLLGVEGFVFDVDDMKKLAQKTAPIVKKVQDELGVDISKLNLKEPENVSKLHEIISDFLGLDKNKMSTLYKSILTAPLGRKPNIIFDVTLKDLYKLNNITREVKKLGYQNEDIHIVWVVNDIEVAKAQNAGRDRVVPVEILINTHRGVSQTMHDIIGMGKDLEKYMNGSIVIAFNKVNVDSAIEASTLNHDTKLVPAKTDKKGRVIKGSFIKEALYIYVKKAGRSVASLSDINKDLRAKIASYVPPGVSWT